MWKTEKSWHPLILSPNPAAKNQSKTGPESRPATSAAPSNNPVNKGIPLDSDSNYLRSKSLGTCKHPGPNMFQLAIQKALGKISRDFPGDFQHPPGCSLLQHLFPSLHKRLRVLMFHTRSCGFLWKLGKPPNPIVYHHDSIDMLLLGIHHFWIYPSSVLLVRSDPIPRRSHKITRTSPPNQP